MKKNNIYKYLNEFKNEVEDYFKDFKWAKEHYMFFKEFLTKKNILKLEKLNEDVAWEKIREIRQYVHSLKTPAFAGIKAFPKDPNYEIGRYINLFKYLITEQEAETQEQRIKKILNREGDLHIRGLATSSLSEIISQAFPNDYVFYNKRNKIGGELCGIDFRISKNDKSGDEFIRYNKALQPLIKEYKKIIYNNKTENLYSKTTIHHEVDQFFNWVYENKVHSSDASVFDENIDYISGKVSKIILSSYNQFKKDLEIDLTYPEGHSKEGEPLDKICIIGQSGTGKTSLLDLIKGFTFFNTEKLPSATKNSVKIEYIHNDNKYVVAPTEKGLESKKIEIENKEKRKKKELSSVNKVQRLIYFPANTFDIGKNIEDEKLISYKDVKETQLLDFKKIPYSIFWKPLQEELKIYQNEKIKKQLEIYEAIKKNEKKDFHKIITEWEAKNKNPLIDLKEYFKNILPKFNLQVKTKIENFGEINEIPIETISNETIKNEYLSLGTKQVISRILPLYSLDVADSIILYDEPENSLFPDIQKIIIEEYINKFVPDEPVKNETDKPQFIFATHSPTIASSFDPWEIVELKFNNEGKVEQELYYEGKRNVKNFKIYPKYLRADRILTDMFEVDNEIFKDRDNMLKELSVIQSKLDYYKEKNKNKKLKVELERFKKLAEKLNWDINY